MRAGALVCHCFPSAFRLSVLPTETAMVAAGESGGGVGYLPVRCAEDPVGSSGLYHFMGRI